METTAHNCRVLAIVDMTIVANVPKRWFIFWAGRWVKER
jgi:hypothetical protein